MKLRFTSRAVENLTEIADYLWARDPAAALRVRAAIYQSLQQLIQFPRLGRRQNAEGVRKLVTRRYGYIVYYAASDADDEVVILNVKHPAQRREHDDG